MDLSSATRVAASLQIVGLHGQKFSNGGQVEKTTSCKRVRYRYVDEDGVTHRTAKLGHLQSRGESCARARTGKSALAAKTVSANSIVALKAAEQYMNASSKKRVALSFGHRRRGGRFSKNARKRLRQENFVTVKGWGKGALRFSLGQMADISKEAMSAPVKTVARPHSCSPVAILDVVRSHGLGEMVVQEVLLLKVGMGFATRPPRGSLVSPMWDETQHKLSIDVAGTVVRQSWPTFVYVVDVCWWYEPGGGFYYLRIVLPPIPLLSTSGDRLWEAMHSHPWTKPIARFLATLSSGSTRFSLEKPCIDWASSNQKVDARLNNARPAEMWRDTRPCMNHQFFLCDGVAINIVFGLQLLIDLHASARFLNSAAVLLRCAITVSDFLMAKVRLTDKPPTSMDKMYTGEVLKLFLHLARHRTTDCDIAGNEFGSQGQGQRKVEDSMQLDNTWHTG